MRFFLVKVWKTSALPLGFPGQFPGQFQGSRGSEKGIFRPLAAYRGMSAKWLIF